MKKICKLKSVKKLLCSALVLSISLLSVGCGVNSNKPTVESIKEKKVLVVGTAPGYPPFEFSKSKDGKSEIVGADIDLAKKLADKLGVKLELRAMEFDALLPALQGGKIDVAITAMTPTDERKKAVDFSDVYYEGTNSIIVSNFYKGDIKTEDDLKKLKIGVQKGSTQEIYAKDVLKAKNVKSLAAVPDLVTDLKNGNIDAVVVSTVVGQINVKQYTDIKLAPNFKMSSETEGEKAAIAIKKGNNKEFIDITNKLIKELKDSGQYQKILDENVKLASEKNK